METEARAKKPMALSKGIIVVALQVLWTLSAPADDWRRYEVYQPRIERYFVLNHEQSTLKYNHCAALAWFKGRWICLWNANTVPKESEPGQLIYMSTSIDAKTWTPAELAFASEARSVNPVYCDRVQWQPGLIVVGDELWCFWSQLSFKRGKKDGNYGCWFSRLRKPDGKWQNRRLLFDGDPDPRFDGQLFRILPMISPTQLSTGRILVPIVMISWKRRADDAPDDKKIWANEKRDSVLYTKDAGATWHASPGTIRPGRSWAQWEPTVWEQPDGTVAMFARNQKPELDPAPVPNWAKTLVWSTSSDGGATWSPLEIVPVETVVSRMHVIQPHKRAGRRPGPNDRFVLCHNDARHGVPNVVRDRDSLALFFTRGAGFDFVAGTSLTGRETIVNYPQMWARDNALHVAYSQGCGSANIKVARVSPLPDPARYYLFPRSRAYPDSARPELTPKGCHFHGHQFVATHTPIRLGSHGFSLGAWVRPEVKGVLFDNRRDGNRGGFVWMLEGRQTLYLCGVGKVVPKHPWLHWFNWNYVGLTVDLSKGEALFYTWDAIRGDAISRIPFDATRLLALDGGTGRIGAAAPADSVLRGLTGDIRFLAVYPTTAFGLEEHRWLANQFAADLKQPELGPAKHPEVQPSVWFDPCDGEGLSRDFVLPPSGKGGTIESIEIDGRHVLQFNGEISAGVDLDANDRERGDTVRLSFEFKLQAGDEHVICTVGDGVEPARVIARKGEAFLCTHEQEVPCGALAPGSWNHVELVTCGDVTRARLNGGDEATVQHRPKATWIYLGQGYRTGQVAPDSAFAIHLASVRSCVSRAAAGPSGDDTGKRK